jgi:hypothetical protein
MDDGRSGGPDIEGFAARLGALRAAERDGGLAILSLLNDRAGMDKIGPVLEQDSTRRSTYSPTTPLLTTYESEKQLEARRLAAQVRLQRLDEFQRIVHMLAAITDVGLFSVAAERHRANAPMLSKFEAADIAVSGQIHPEDGSCPQPGWNMTDIESCVAYLKIRHSYKGPEREGEDLRIEYRLDPRGRGWVGGNQEGMLSINEFFLFLGCQVGGAYHLCPNSGPMRMSPVVSLSSTAKGLDLLAADAVAGLASPKEMDISWSAGLLRAFDVQDQIDKLKAAKASVTLNNALSIDALLVRSGDYADAKADLELALSMPEAKNSGGLGSLVQAMTAAPTSAMDDEVALLAKSPRMDVRELALKLLQLHPEGTSILVLRDMLDDPEPAILFSVTRVLESRTGQEFSGQAGLLRAVCQGPAIPNVVCSGMEGLA